MYNTDKENKEEEKVNRKLRDLNKEQKEKLNRCLERNKEIFSTGEYDIGKTNILKCKIEFKDGEQKPIKQRATRMTPEERKLAKKETEELLKLGVIEESFSEWATPAHFVPKKGGKKRLVFNYRALNAITKRDEHPIPRTDELLGRFCGAKWFSSLDATKGFWNIEMEHKDKEKTAFILPDGLYQWKRMPFGLCNAPATFQRMMNKALGNLVYTKVLVYIDDIIIYSDTFEQHLKDIEEVFRKLKEANIKLSRSKCYFCQDEVEFLGYRVGQMGVKTVQSKIEKIQNYPIPKDVTQLRGFLGLAGYYRKFIKKFSEIVKPLSELLQKDKEYIWGKEQQKAFERIKGKLTSTPVLAHPDFEKPFIITTDASKTALAAVLEQADKHGKEHSIEFIHKTLSKQEQRWHSNDWEIYAIVWAIEKFAHYFGNRKFLLRTDSGNFKWWLEQPIEDGKRGRWKLKLHKYNFDVQHIKGSKNKVADNLSRVNYEE